MTKNLAFSLLLALSPEASFAAQIVVDNPCSSEFWLSTDRPRAIGKSVGEVTITVLDEAAIPYVGNAAGISSIKDTLRDKPAVEVLSDTEIRAYGWCYSFNGQEPDQMPDQIFVQSEQDEIRWYFGYAHYKDGAWISYCTKTSETRPAYVCGER